MSTLASPPVPSSGPAAARVAAAGFAIASSAILALHFAQPEFHVWHEPVSFYVHGRQGWLLPLALLAFGLGSLALGHRAKRDPDFAAAAEPLRWFGAGMLIDAAAPSDAWFPWEGPPSVSGVVHASAAVLAPLALLVAIMRCTRAAAFRDGARRRHARWAALGYATGLVGSAASLLLGFVLDRPPPLIGAGERLLALSGVGWCWFAARELASTPASPAGGDRQTRPG